MHDIAIILRFYPSPNKLLSHYQGGCLHRCPYIDSPARTSMAVVVDDLDARILSNAFINFQPCCWSAWSEAYPLVLWFDVLGINPQCPGILDESFSFLPSNSFFSIAFQISTTDNKHISSRNYVRRFRLTAPRRFFNHYGRIIRMGSSSMRIWPSFTHAIVMQKDASTTDNLIIPTQVASAQSTTIDNRIAAQSFGIFDHMIQGFIVRVGININGQIMHLNF